MANALGSLVVRLGLDAAEFVTGIEKSDREAKRFAQRMEANGRVIGQALGLGVTVAAGALFLMTKNAIDAADKLNDLSKSTGISVETLGGLGFAAKQSGTDIDGVANSVGKLNLRIASAIAGNQDAAQAFANVGISLKELRNSSPDQILQKLADQFATYDGHANTAALANVFFGKSYQSILPLLKEGGESLRRNIDYYEKYGGVTTKTAQQSDEFNDTLAKLGLLSGQFGRQLAVELLPALNSLAEAFVKGTEKGGAFKDSASDIAAVIKGIAVAAIAGSSAVASLGNVIGARAAQAAALARLDFAGFKAINEEVTRDEAARAERTKRLINSINNPTAGTSVAGAGGGRGQRAPGLPDSGAAGAANAAARALLDAQLKEIDRGVKLEQDLLKDREHFLQQYYQDDLISIAKYYSQRQAFLDESVQKEVAANNEKIELLRGAKPKDEVERIKNERDIADFVADSAKKQREYFRESIDGRMAEDRAVKQYKESLDQLAVTLATMRGDTVSAAGIGFDQQNAQLRTRMGLEGTSTAGLDELRKRTVDQAALSKETLKYSNIVEGLSIAQARVDLLAQTGSIGEIEALGKKDALAKRFVETLTLQANAYEKIALAMEKGPAKDAALLDVERIRLGIDQLAASGDSLAKKFNDVFADAFGDNLLAAIEGTKSLGDAFKGMEKDIVRSLNQIAINEIKTYLFGGKGALSGAGAGMASLFGGGTGNNGLIGTAVSAIASYFTGGAGIGYGAAGSAMSNLGAYPYAAGTDFHPGGRALVGERGPEIINLPRGAQVIPNHELMARREQKNVTVKTTFILQGAVTRETQSQIAVKTGSAVRRAVARDD